VVGERELGSAPKEEIACACNGEEERAKVSAHGASDVRRSCLNGELAVGVRFLREGKRGEFRRVI
jgi:hypothetical protein